jgi:hypothetical protein
MQGPQLLTAFLIISLLIGPACWVLTGIGRVANTLVDDVCVMMDKHVHGEPNQWVLDSMQCNELAGAMDAAEEMMRVSNQQVADSNTIIAGAVQLHNL